MTSADVGFGGRLHPTLVHHLVATLGWTELRPLQSAAAGPLLDGDDALLVAPTAGGKTEAAVFPLLTAMASGGWGAPSVVYVAPLKALLNNLLPRLEAYAGWLGRRAALWHGDVTTGARARLLRDPPDLLLTTPESLESMLVSVKVDHYRLFGGLRVVVADEVHAFAADDRGWHLLAVLERLTRIAGRPIQRIGLSATVGNPDELLSWLQGSASRGRPGHVIAPDIRLPPQVTSYPALDGDPVPIASASGSPVAAIGPSGDVQLDYVGSAENAARVIAALHQGEKRLVFCESRALVEQLGASLRALGVNTFLSHASLSMAERHRAEQAFATSRDCVIVATSTLELGIDVGDLDRVIQVGAPATVASFLQRFGRSGRRAGAQRNCLFLALDKGSLVAVAGLLVLWGRGWVEPVVPPAEPRHIAAQQILALCLQEGRVGENLWPQWWADLPMLGQLAQPVATYLRDEGFLESEDGMLFIGPQAEQRFGFRHFMSLTTTFTVAPQFTVLCGRDEIGRADPTLLAAKVHGPRVLLLAGQSWRVTWTDWKRRRCHVEPADGGGLAKWIIPDGDGMSFALSRAIRHVLLGTDPPARLTKRARSALADARESAVDLVHPGGTVIRRTPSGDVHWWTWAGWHANATLVATLASDLADPAQQVDALRVRLRGDVTMQSWKAAMSDVTERLCLPAVDGKALAGLKFSEALPKHLAEATLAWRLADLEGARIALAEPHRFLVT